LVVDEPVLPEVPEVVDPLVFVLFLFLCLRDFLVFPLVSVVPLFVVPWLWDVLLLVWPDDDWPLAVEPVEPVDWAKVNGTATAVKSADIKSFFMILSSIVFCVVYRTKAA
jgi:hypothetical protein